jgi:ribosomal protein S18 acetylase RimI-like enzyme
MRDSSDDPRLDNRALDNPVWESLASRHAALAQRMAHAARYPSDAAPFVAVDVADARAATELAQLVQVGESVLFVGLAPPLAPNAWRVEPLVHIAQMTCRSQLQVNDGPPITELTRAQVADMLALTALVYPHYFRPRTIEMGRYFGIHAGDLLVAMAGERMGFAGHREISAICTHPDHTGRGHAQRLTAMLTNDILDRGDIPFLHVSHQNGRAKSLYERIGYRFRADIPLLGAQRLDDGANAREPFIADG